MTSPAIRPALATPVSSSELGTGNVRGKHMRPLKNL